MGVIFFLKNFFEWVVSFFQREQNNANKYALSHDGENEKTKIVKVQDGISVQSLRYKSNQDFRNYQESIKKNLTGFIKEWNRISQSNNNGNNAVYVSEDAIVNNGFTLSVTFSTIESKDSFKKSIEKEIPNIVVEQPVRGVFDETSDVRLKLFHPFVEPSPRDCTFWSLITICFSALFTLMFVLYILNPLKYSAFEYFYLPFEDVVTRLFPFIGKDVIFP